MTCAPVSVRELAGWQLDDYEFRPPPTHPKKLSVAQHLIALRAPYSASAVLLVDETEQLRTSLSQHSNRADLLREMAGLSWSLGVIDLRLLIAFQRRLFFHPRRTLMAVEHNSDALLNLSFAPSPPLVCKVTHDLAANVLVVQSSNPNVRVWHTDEPSSPVCLDSGSPFFEVACFRERWFLRDGYHRAYSLLKAGIFAIPAVIVHANTIEELGAVKPWFFPEEILFSHHPPRVLDFLNDDFVLTYDRPSLIKTIRITVEETLTPALSSGEN